MAKFGEVEHFVRSESQFSGTMYDKDEILHGSTPFVGHEDRTCIYVLIDGDSIVYVGQTSNLISRLAQHAKTKRFTRYWSVDCPRDELSAAEAEYIVKLNPAMNIHLPSNPEYIMQSAAKKMMGDWRRLQHAVRSGVVKPIHIYAGLVFRVSEIKAAMAPVALKATGRGLR